MITRVKRDETEGEDLGELGDLAGQADLLGQPEAAPAAAAPAPAPGESNAEILLGVFVAIRETFCAVVQVQSPQRTASDQVLAPLAKLWADVADKHGFDLKGMMGDYLTEIKAIGVTIAVARTVAKELGQELQAKKASQQPVQDVTPQADGDQAP
jgi:hypothetical protein